MLHEHVLSRAISATTEEHRSSNYSTTVTDAAYLNFIINFLQNAHEIKTRQLTMCELFIGY